ncbi:MAG: choice-of-anchor D domain-containing protein [Myxococcales bacterium]|jgi:hypothetical protein
MGVLGRGLWAVVCLQVAWAAGGCGGTGLSPSLSAIELSDTSFEFGLVALGRAASKQLYLRNSGRTTVRVETLQAPAPFSIEGFPAKGFSLEPGAEREVLVLFAPQVEGEFEAALTLRCDVEDGVLDLPMKGKGVLALVSVGAKELDFGEVVIGDSSILEIELSNDTSLPAEARLRVEGVDAPAFTSSAIGTNDPLTVDPGERRPIPIAFHPNHLGSAEAMLYVTPCAGCAEVGVTLRGTGTATCVTTLPGAIDFGTVEVGRELSQTVEVLNNGNAPLTVPEVFLASGSSPDFRFEGFVEGMSRTLQPGKALTLTVLFKPSSKGPRTAALRIHGEGAGRSCWSEVRLAGGGGTGCLEISPTAIDFGTIASGMTARETLFLANTGCGSDVWIEALGLTGDPQFTAASLRPTPFLLEEGQVAEVAITFSPAQPGTYRAALHVEASDDMHRPLSQPPGDVPIDGSARALAPCDFAVTPPRLDFGTLDVGTRGRLAFKLFNLGQDGCYFSNLGLSLNSASAFSIEGASPGFMLPAGKAYDVAIEFAPQAPGSYVSTLELYVSDSSNPYRTYPIFGAADRGCLSIQPRDLDFGTVFVSCPNPTRATVVSNQCSGAVSIVNLVRGPGTSLEFFLPNPPSLPLTLAAGEALTLQLRYAPQDDGLDAMPLFVDDGATLHLVSARGAGVVDPYRTDSFSQSLQEKVDVLFVLDNSGSMADKQAAVGANLSAFIQDAIAQSVDYRIAVTTTGIEPSTGGWTACPGGAEGGEAGRLFPVDGTRPRVITPTTSNPEAIWAANTNVGVCHWLEQGLEASYRALSPPLVDHSDDPRTVMPNDGNGGFLRPDAKLVLIYVSDEDDQSPASVDFYLTFLQSLKPDPSKLAVSVIVSPLDLTTCTIGTASGRRYMDLATRTGGQIESICTPDWGASLERLGSNAFGAQSVFPLSAVPEDPAQLRVRVNGAIISGGQGSWIYDPAANAIVFDKSAVPPSGSHIEVNYPIGCPAP